MEEDYKILKLLTNEFVFGNVTRSFSDGSLELYDPRILYAKEDGMFMMVPYCFYTDEETMVFNYGAIVTVVKATPNLIETYKEWLTKEKDELINTTESSKLAH